MTVLTETQVNDFVTTLHLHDGTQVTLYDFKRYGENGWEWSYISSNQEMFPNDIVFHTNKQGVGLYMNFDAGLSRPMTICIELSDKPVIRLRTPMEVFVQAQQTLFSFLQEASCPAH